MLFLYKNFRMIWFEFMCWKALKIDSNIQTICGCTPNNFINHLCSRFHDQNIKIPVNTLETMNDNLDKQFWIFSLSYSTFIDWIHKRLLFVCNNNSILLFTRTLKIINHYSLFIECAKKKIFFFFLINHINSSSFFWE